MERLLSCAGCVVLRQPKCFDIQGNRYFHVISVTLKQNHYQVLGVKHKATSKEIRTAFVKRTKEVHPDKNPDDPENHDKFVRVHKAYSILSKPYSRRMYDHSLVHRAHVRERMMEKQSRTTEPRSDNKQDINRDHSEYESYEYDQTYWREFQRKHGTKPYYTDSNNNIPVLRLILLLVFIGWMSFFIAIMYSNMRRNAMDKLSQKNHAMYEKQKAKASQYTLEQRLEQVRLKAQKRKAAISGNEE